MRKLLLISCAMALPAHAALAADPKTDSPITLNLDVLDTLRPAPVPAYQPGNVQQPGTDTGPGHPMYVIVPKPADNAAVAASKPVLKPVTIVTKPAPVAVAAEKPAAQQFSPVKPGQIAPAPAQEPAQVPQAQPLVASAPENVQSNAAVDNAPPAGAPGLPGPPGEPVGPAAFINNGYVQAGGDYHNVSHNLGNWAGEYVKGEIQTDPSNRWNGELLHQHEFKDDGEYLDVGNTHDFDEDWYSNLTVGGGNAADFLPRYRVDAFLNRKWLEQRQLITTFGVGLYKSMDEHRDQSLFLGATYYFPTPWVIQGGVRYNNSHPGGVNSFSEFMAVTQGRDKDYLLTLRYGYGKEAYQILDANNVLSSFNSNDVSLELRDWLGSDWGFDARIEEYYNPVYNRVGVDAGVFKEF